MIFTLNLLFYAGHSLKKIEICKHIEKKQKLYSLSFNTIISIEKRLNA